MKLNKSTGCKEWQRTIKRKGKIIVSAILDDNLKAKLFLWLLGTFLVFKLKHGFALNSWFNSTINSNFQSSKMSSRFLFHYLNFVFTRQKWDRQFDYKTFPCPIENEINKTKYKIQLFSVFLNKAHKGKKVIDFFVLLSFPRWVPFAVIFSL